MNEIGFLKEIDSLGRIVIPKELRQRYKLTDKVEVIPTKHGVLIKKQEYFLTRKTKD